MTVEDFVATVGPSGVHAGSGGPKLEGPTIVGEPFHTTESALVESYRSHTLEGFLQAEASASMGNYVLVDSAAGRIVTAPGYSGGYLSEAVDGAVVATTIGSLLGQLPASPSFDEPVLCHYYERDLLHHPPYRTVFEGVERLPPAYVVEIGDGGVERRTGYAQRVRPNAGPDDFAGVMDEVMGGLANTVDGTDRRVCILFSGGIDSLCLLVGARKHLPPDSLRVITCDDGRLSDGPFMARRLADALGFEIELVGSNADSWPPRRESVLDRIDESLGRDFIKATTANAGITGEYVGADDVLLSGMNFGAWTRGLRAGHNTPLPEGGSLVDLVRYVRSTGVPVKRLGLELTHSAPYVRHRWLRVLFLKYLALSNREATFRFDQSNAGFLRGILDYRFPNVAYRDDADPFSLYDTEPEVRRFLSEVRDRYDQRSLDLLFFYWFAHHGQKALSTLPGPSGAHTSVPIMWGPANAYFQGTRRGWSHFLFPKRVYYDYVAEETGRRYNDLTGLSASERREVRHNSTRWDPFYPGEYESLLDSATSSVLRAVSENSIAATVEEAYEEASHTLHSSEPVRNAALEKLTRVINLERIVAANR